MSGASFGRPDEDGGRRGAGGVCGDGRDDRGGRQDRNSPARRRCWAHLDEPLAIVTPAVGFVRGFGSDEPGAVLAPRRWRISKTFCRDATSGRDLRSPTPSPDRRGDRRRRSRPGRPGPPAGRAPAPGGSAPAALLRVHDRAPHRGRPRSRSPRSRPSIGGPAGRATACWTGSSRAGPYSAAGDDAPSHGEPDRGLLPRTPRDLGTACAAAAPAATPPVARVAAPAPAQPIAPGTLRSAAARLPMLPA